MEPDMAAEQDEVWRFIKETDKVPTKKLRVESFEQMTKQLYLLFRNERIRSDNAMQESQVLELQRELHMAHVEHNEELIAIEKDHKRKLDDLTAENTQLKKKLKRYEDSVKTLVDTTKNIK